MTEIIVDGTPMEFTRAHHYLEAYWGIPLALRMKGTIDVICPYCGGVEDVGEVEGHQEAQCHEEIRREIEITINERKFVPNYGFTVIEYTGNGELRIPDNLLRL